MKGAREIYLSFKYRAPTVFKGADWYVVWSSGHTNIGSRSVPCGWKELSDWCNETYGHDNWEFLNNQCVFKSESDLVVYLLRWS